jgi:hypothetical protein
MNTGKRATKSDKRPEKTNARDPQKLRNEQKVEPRRGEYQIKNV